MMLCARQPKEKNMTRDGVNKCVWEKVMIAFEIEIWKLEAAGVVELAKPQCGLRIEWYVSGKKGRV